MLLSEKSIQFKTNEPQFVIMAGGGGSGKGFAVKNFLDARNFKIYDVDSMKEKLIQLNVDGKITIDSILKKYENSANPTVIKYIKSHTVDVGKDIKDLNLSNPEHTGVLHQIASITGLHNKRVNTALQGAAKSGKLFNVIFDITMREPTKFIELCSLALSVGYAPENIHLIWVLADITVALANNKNPDRGRQVDADILYDAHDNVRKSFVSAIETVLDSRIDFNGRITVILNNTDLTVNYPVSKFAKRPERKVVKDFTYLDIKKQGKPIKPTDEWIDQLVTWISQNTPDDDWLDDFKRNNKKYFKEGISMYDYFF